MAAHDIDSDIPTAPLAALVGLSEAEAATIHAEVERERETEDLIRALEIAAADLHRARSANLLTLDARNLRDAHQIADVSVIELAVAHRAALTALEKARRPRAAPTATVVPFPGRRA